MDKTIGKVGLHGQVEILDRKDVNGRFMARCNICETYAHAYDENQAVEDLRNCSCSPGCLNCHNLKNSCATQPAVPKNGTCNDRLHVCPNDQNKWWQSNNYFHLWQQVTNNREWKILNKEHQLT